MTSKACTAATYFLYLTGLVFWSGITVPSALESFDLDHSLTAYTGAVARDPLAIQVYTVYCQVIGSMFLVYARWE